MPTWGKNAETGEEVLTLSKREAEQLRRNGLVTKCTEDERGEWELRIELKNTRRRYVFRARLKVDGVTTTQDFMAYANADTVWDTLVHQAVDQGFIAKDHAMLVDRISWFDVGPRPAGIKATYNTPHLLAKETA